MAHPVDRTYGRKREKVCDLCLENGMMANEPDPIQKKACHDHSRRLN
jgi:hypothetical protein